MPDETKTEIDLSEHFNNTMQLNKLAYNMIPYGIFRTMVYGLAMKDVRANNYFGFKLRISSNKNGLNYIIGPGESARIINYCINQLLPPTKTYYKQYAKSKDCAYIYRALDKKNDTIPTNCSMCIANCLAQI